MKLNKKLDLTIERQVSETDYVAVDHLPDGSTRHVAFRKIPEGADLTSRPHAYHARRREDGHIEADLIYENPNPEIREGSGPAKVNSEAYRSGWNRVFGPN